MSTDGGASWSTPIKVNQTPSNRPLGNQQAFIPSVSVDSSGSVGVTYYDFRNNNEVGPGLATDYWFVRRRSNCGTEASWLGSELRLTDTSFDITKAPNRGGYFVGDYQGLAGTDVFLSFFAMSDTDFGNIFFRAIGP